MPRDFLLKLALILMIVFGSVYMWFTSSAEDNPELEEQLDGLFGGLIPPFLSEQLNLTGMTTKDYCPYINPYMSQLFSTGALEVTKSSPIHGALEYVYGKEERNLEFSCSSSMAAIYNYDTEEYALSCKDEISSEIFLSTSKMIEGLNESSVKTGFGLSLKDKIPGWQCLLFFGLMPFFAMFFFLKDILQFTPLRDKVKYLIILMTSFLAIMTGTFSNFVWQLAHIASMSVQATFLIVLLIFMFISLLLNWISSFSNAFAAGRKMSAQAAAGLAQRKMLSAVSQTGSSGSSPKAKKQKSIKDYFK